VRFHDACHILKGDNILCDSLLTFVLCVMNNYSCTIVVTSSICIFSDFVMWYCD
jgi:hypothetical protein